VKYHTVQLCGFYQSIFQEIFIIILVQLGRNLLYSGIIINKIILKATFKFTVLLLSTIDLL